jgi:hypothetical protein
VTEAPLPPAIQAAAAQSRVQIIVTEPLSPDAKDF